MRMMFRQLRVGLAVLALASVFAGTFLRLDPSLGAADDLARAIAAETDPVAKLLLARSGLCNPSGKDHGDGKSHRHCDACLFAFAGAVLPEAEILSFRFAPLRLPVPAGSDGEITVAGIHWPHGRAPPLNA